MRKLQKCSYYRGRDAFNAGTRTILLYDQDNDIQNAQAPIQYNHI